MILVAVAAGAEAEDTIDLVAEEKDFDRPGACLPNLFSLRATDLDRCVVFLIDELVLRREWLVVSPASLDCPACPLEIILCKN